MTWFAQLKRACLVLPGLAGFARGRLQRPEFEAPEQVGRRVAVLGLVLARAEARRRRGRVHRERGRVPTRPVAAAATRVVPTAAAAAAARRAWAGRSGSEEPYPIPENLPGGDRRRSLARYPKVPIPGRLAEYQAAFTQW